MEIGTAAFSNAFANKERTQKSFYDHSSVDSMQCVPLFGSIKRWAKFILDTDWNFFRNQRRHIRNLMQITYTPIKKMVSAKLISAKSAHTADSAESDFWTAGASSLKVVAPSPKTNSVPFWLRGKNELKRDWNCGNCSSAPESNSEEAENKSSR